MLARATLVGVLILVGYYVLPMDSSITGISILAVGLLVTAGVLAWHVRAIMNSPLPRLRAYEILLMGIPLLLSVFAAATTCSARPRSTFAPSR